MNRVAGRRPSSPSLIGTYPQVYMHTQVINIRVAGGACGAARRTNTRKQSRKGGNSQSSHKHHKKGKRGRRKECWARPALTRTAADRIGVEALSLSGPPVSFTLPKLCAAFRKIERRRQPSLRMPRPPPVQSPGGGVDHGTLVAALPVWQAFKRSPHSIHSCLSTKKPG